MRPFRASEIRGNWATLLLAWNEDDSLDLGRVRNEIECLIEMQVDGIYCNGTAGEFYALTEREFDQVAEALADRCEQAGMPFQIGVSQMSAQISLARLRRSIALAPVAIQVILPDWFPTSDREAADFLERMADEAEGIGLVLYNPPHAKRVLQPAEMAQLTERVPALVGIKVAGGDRTWYAEMKPLFERLSVFVPGHHLATGRSLGAHGSYSNVACLHPGVAQQWSDQIDHDLPAALGIERRLREFMEQYISPFIHVEKYSNAACDRLLALIGGWADVGAHMRWPYRAIPVSEADRLRPIARQMLPEFFCDE